MVQTIVMIIVLLVLAAVVQQNGAGVHATTSLVLPGATNIPVSLLRLIAAIGAAAVVVWLAGLVDLAVLSGRLRRREAAHRAMEQELARIKATAYDTQRPLLADLRTRLEEIVQEMAGMLGRVEARLRQDGEHLAAAAPPPEPVPVGAERTVREDVVETPAGPVTRRETVEGPAGTEVVERPKRRWPL
jgi:hypothetical protein